MRCNMQRQDREEWSKILRALDGSWWVWCRMPWGSSASFARAHGSPVRTGGSVHERVIVLAGREAGSQAGLAGRPFLQLGNGQSVLVNCWLPRSLTLGDAECDASNCLFFLRADPCL